MKRTFEFWASLVGAVVAAFFIAIWVPGDPNHPEVKVKLAIEYGGLVITFLFGFMILAGIASGTIDISKILEEKAGPSGAASMSRFQLLIFTFVIAISLFLIVVSTGDFPKTIPPEIMTLLGISATTYGVSKGIQHSSQSNGGQNGDGGTSTTPPPVAPAPPVVAVPPVVTVPPVVAVPPIAPAPPVGPAGG